MTDDEPVVVRTYPNSVEAAFARHLLEQEGLPATLGAETSATLLSYYGTAVGGVRLLVRRADLDAASRVLTAGDADSAEYDWPEFPDGGAEADREENGAPIEIDPGVERRLRRAYYAAVIGMVLAPPLLAIYSLYLITRHRLYLPERGGRSWRFYVAMLVNVSAVLAVIVLWTL